MNPLLLHAQALARRGDFSAAAEFCGKAIERGEDVALAKKMLAGCLHDLGLKLWLEGVPEAAEKHFHAALAVDPEHVDALNNLGALLQLARQYGEAMGCYQRALQVDPANVRVLENLAKTQQHMGKLGEASATLLRLATIAGGEAAAYLIREALLVAKIIPDQDYPARIRQTIPEKLRAIESAGARMSLPLRFPSTYFPLSYQGICNKELVKSIARAHLQAAPSLNWTAPHVPKWRAPKERTKIGFASRFFRGHSIGNTARGLVEHLDRRAYEVFLIRLGALAPDETAARMDKSADHVVTVPYDDLQAARDVVAGLSLDILFYQDIGMEPLSYLLAFSRLAPVQLTSFGHPDTTGIPNMDYFLSSENYEIDGAQDHYAERLMLVPNAGTLSYYYRPPAPSDRTRQSFGLQATDHVYACPQALFKIHPVMDDLFKAILTDDPRARIVLIDPRDEELRPALERRLQRSLRDLTRRVTFVDSLAYQDFLSLVRSSDVMLDTVHFNGQNTSLEAFAMSVPVITLPGRLQRERHTYGMYRAMGFMELVAATPEQYVALAMRVANDEEYREHCRSSIAQSCGVLYENMDFVRNCGKAFQVMLSERRNGAPSKT